MKKFPAFSFLLVVLLVQTQLSWAYLLPVAGYQDGAHLYIDTDTIVRNPPLVNLSYVVSFDQPQSYGAIDYSSSATAIKIDCNNKMIFAISVVYYSDINLQGEMLGRYLLNDSSGNLPVDGSWDRNLANIACLPRRY
jgi:hypothetical protein